MRWAPGDRSNVEDMRGRSGGRVATVGVGGLLMVLALSWLTGTDLTSLLETAPPSETVGSSGSTPTSPEEERMVDLVDAVMRDAQATWSQALGGRYEPTRVVLFRDAIESACGGAQSATGPFYCPSD